MNRVAGAILVLAGAVWGAGVSLALMVLQASGIIAMAIPMQGMARRGEKFNLNLGDLDVDVSLAAIPASVLIGIGLIMIAVDIVHSFRRAQATPSTRPENEAPEQSPAGT